MIRSGDHRHQKINRRYNQKQKVPANHHSLQNSKTLLINTVSLMAEVAKMSNLEEQYITSCPQYIFAQPPGPIAYGIWACITYPWYPTKISSTSWIFYCTSITNACDEVGKISLLTTIVPFFFGMSKHISEKEQTHSHKLVSVIVIKLLGWKLFVPEFPWFYTADGVITDEILMMI